MHISRLLAVCGLLAAVGCAETEVIAVKNIEGCRVKCDLCVNLTSACIEQAKDIGAQRDKEISEPGTGMEMIKGKK